MTARLIKAQQLVPPNNLAARNAVGIGEHQIKGLNIRMLGQKFLGFAKGRALGHRAGLLGANSWAITSSKAAIRRLTWRFSVAGEISIML